MTQICRRSFLGGAAALAALHAGPAIAFARKPFFKRVGLPIGLQLYTLGAEPGRDLDGTFAHLAGIGYREVELPNLLGHAPGDLKAAADRSGIAITSLHLPLLATAGPSLSLASEASRIADVLGVLGAKNVAAPIMLLPAGMRPAPGEAMGSAIARAVAVAGPDIWQRSAGLLNKKGAALKPLGVQLAYHNHNIEFAPVGSMTGWEILQRETDPALVRFQVDIGWVATAGLDPVRFLKTCRGRVSSLHVKDVAADNQQNFSIAMKPAEVGAGTLAWNRILPAAYDAGVRHFYVEQEPPFSIPRIEAAARSFGFLSKV